MNTTLKSKLFPRSTRTLLYIALSCLTPYSFASDITTCPRLSSLKTEGITDVVKSSYGTSYYPQHISAYDTKVVWKLIILDNMGNGKRTEEEAIAWGNKILQEDVFGNPDPVFVNCKRYDKCVAECKYESSWHYVVARTTDYY